MRRLPRSWPLIRPTVSPAWFEPLGAAGGFSGASFWRLTTARGPLCLRRWPAGYPAVDQFQFIQAVLWHVDLEGFQRIPLPLEAADHAGYVTHDGCFWELAPWLPGVADYHAFPSEQRLAAALTALAEFHRAAVSFPLADIGPAPSPGIQQRQEHFLRLRGGAIRQLADAIHAGHWPELAARGRRLVQLFSLAAESSLALIAQASRVQIALQPCIRDIWHDHVLFSGDRVSGIVDFGSLRPDNVATDVARLLGSLVGDDRSRLGTRPGRLSIDSAVVGRRTVARGRLRPDHRYDGRAAMAGMDLSGAQSVSGPRRHRSSTRPGN